VGEGEGVGVGGGGRGWGLNRAGKRALLDFYLSFSSFTALHTEQ
jgi:hypothetical protein